MVLLHFFPYKYLDTIISILTLFYYNNNNNNNNNNNSNNNNNNETSIISYLTLLKKIKYHSLM